VERKSVPLVTVKLAFVIVGAVKSAATKPPPGANINAWGIVRESVPYAVAVMVIEFAPPVSDTVPVVSTSSSAYWCPCRNSSCPH